MIGWMLDKAVGWFYTTVLRRSLDAVWALLVATVFHLPNVTLLPQVQALSARALMVVNISYALVIMVTGLIVMAHGTVQVRYTAAELLPRLVFGLVAANFGTAICTAIIATTNTLVQALTGHGVLSANSQDQVKELIVVQLSSLTANILAIVIGLIIVVLVLALIITWISRFIALVVLCGIAPITLACHATPWTDPLARLWWQGMGVIALPVILQALTLHTTLSIFLDPDANLPASGFPYHQNGLLNLLLFAVLLGFTVRIPALIRRHLGSGGGRPNILGAMVRLVIVQQITRGLGTAVRGARTPRPPAPGPGRGVHRGFARHGIGRPVRDPSPGLRLSSGGIPVEDMPLPHRRTRERPSTAAATRRSHTAAGPPARRRAQASPGAWEVLSPAAQRRGASSSRSTPAPQKRPAEPPPAARGPLPRRRPDPPQNPRPPQNPLPPRTTSRRRPPSDRRNP